MPKGQSQAIWQYKYVTKMQMEPNVEPIQGAPNVDPMHCGQICTWEPSMGLLYLNFNHINQVLHSHERPAEVQNGQLKYRIWLENMRIRGMRFGSRGHHQCWRPLLPLPLPLLSSSPPATLVPHMLRQPSLSWSRFWPILQLESLKGMVKSIKMWLGTQIGLHLGNVNFETV